MDPVKRRRKAEARKAAKSRSAAAGGSTQGHRGEVVSLALTPERMLERVAKKFLQNPTNSCVKCGSTFIAYEPAFIHCHYCGKMARIANASLGAQELFELRLGLRLAS